MGEAALPEVRNAVAPTSEAHRDVTAPSSPTKASIARETELLAEVQRALKSGQALKALYTLDRHAEEFPTGQLYEEATAARVVALCSVGRIQDGRRWTDEFIRRYPNSPLSARVRSACNKGGTTD
jgi:RNA polymerase sigma-70 factor (ECF subfamily)